MWKNLQKKLGSSESYVSLALGLAVILMLGSLVYNYATQKSGPASQTQKTEELKNAENITTPTKHTVVKGETLWTIAQKYYNDGYKWVNIQKANNLKSADDIEVGQALDIPSAVTNTPATVSAVTGATGEVTGTSTTGAAANNKTYKVVKGDYLWKIALREYNNGYKWVDIAKANNLKNPDLIYPDTVLVLP